MTPETRRRKNQKKYKRRKYSRCSYCGGRADIRLRQVGIPHRLNPETPVKTCHDCGVVHIMPHGSGGGIGRRIPCGDYVIDGERLPSCAGSSPALIHLDDFGGIEPPLRQKSSEQAARELDRAIRRASITHFLIVDVEGET